MNAEPIKNTDLSKVLKKEHENKWIALSLDRSKVLAAGKTILELDQRVDPAEAVYMYVLPRDISFAFTLK